MIEVQVICRKNSEVVGRVSRAKPGWAVYDDRKRVIGRVVSVFGPVSSPYVKLSLKSGGREGKLYIGGAGKWRKKRRRRNG
jgi:rRNA processing protein Gar1